MVMKHEKKLALDYLPDMLQEEILDNEEKDGDEIQPIDIDGKVYMIPAAVNFLIDSLVFQIRELAKQPD
jgi:hypothetical protein